jgi:predicted RNA polymerase sigma factor
VGGLTTAEIARALLVPEATVGQRISRAKQRIRDSGAQFRLPPPDELAPRLGAVLTVLYLIFNEGYTASAGNALYRVELTAEAIRLARQLHDRLPDDGEVSGLLALMLLTDARRPARIGADGALVPLTEQDRSRWDAGAIADGISLITRSLTTTRAGPFQLQAAIAAVHDQARHPQDTDWPQILTLYNLLQAVAPSPVVALNRIVAIAMAHGPPAGLAELATAEADPALAGHYRIDAVRAHLLDLAGDRDAARTLYQHAARRTLNLPEQRYLTACAARI